MDTLLLVYPGCGGDHLMSELSPITTIIIPPLEMFLEISSFIFLSFHPPMTLFHSHLLSDACEERRDEKDISSKEIVDVIAVCSE